MKPKQIRYAGEKLGREGLAKRAQEIMQAAMEDGSYKAAIDAAGRLAVIAAACDYDVYWKEKKDIGKQCEKEKMDTVLSAYSV